MNRIINTIIAVILVLIIKSCANISVPTGGPKDTEAPKLIYTTPKNNSTNFKDKSIELKFNESIQEIADVNQILINPKLKKDIKVKVKKKRYLVIDLNNELNSNTTYSINFRNTIKDLNEGNLTTNNISYSFSTGEKLDTNQLIGTAIDMIKNIPKAKVIVGLYDRNDTISIEKDKPLYLTEVEKDGKFTINNIKMGSYNVFAFHDANSTLLYDNEEKIIDFYDSIYIDKKKELNFKLSKIKKKGVKIQNIKSINKNECQITLNSGIKMIEFKDSIGNPIKKQIHSNGKLISIYNEKYIYTDSTNLYITAIDSLDTKVKINTKVLFIDNQSKNKKKNKDEGKILQPSNYQLNNNNQKIEIKFNHPITKINKENIELHYDSANVESNKNIEIEFVNDSTELMLKSNVKFKDSLILKIPKNSIWNINGDTIEAIKQLFKPITEKNEGKISGKVNIDSTYSILEILDDKSIVIEKKYGKNWFDFEFNQLKPGKYKLRAIIDKNNNKQWDQGDWKTMKRAEEIIYYENEIILKKDWEINDIIFKKSNNDVNR